MGFAFVSESLPVYTAATTTSQTAILSVIEGNLIVVGYSVRGANGNMTSLTTTDGGTPVKQVGPKQGGGSTFSALWSWLAGSTGLSTITLTPAVSMAMHYAALQFSGVTSATANATASANATSTAPSPGAIAVSKAGDLVVAVMGWDSAYPTNVGSAGAEAMGGVITNGYGAVFFYQKAPSTSNVTLQAAVNTTPVWTSSGASFVATADATGGGSGIRSLVSSGGLVV